MIIFDTSLLPTTKSSPRLSPCDLTSLTHPFVTHHPITNSPLSNEAPTRKPASTTCKEPISRGKPRQHLPKQSQLPNGDPHVFAAQYPVSVPTTPKRASNMTQPQLLSTNSVSQDNGGPAKQQGTTENLAHPHAKTTPTQISHTNPHTTNMSFFPSKKSLSPCTPSPPSSSSSPP
jgi:hypothetical protein